MRLTLVCYCPPACCCSPAVHPSARPVCPPRLPARSAGYTLMEMREAAYSATDLKTAEFTATQLRKVRALSKAASLHACTLSLPYTPLPSPPCTPS